MDEEGKSVYLFGGDNKKCCLDDLMEIATNGDTLITHNRNENKIFEAVKGLQK